MLRSVVISVAGTIVLLAGVAMVVLPGPAFILIPAGLAILATQFEWARRLFTSVCTKSAACVKRFRSDGRLRRKQ